MIFRKPTNVNFIDMCIFIDNNAYSEKHDAQKIYEYLYHIIRIMSKVRKFFKCTQYYDDFAIFGATRVYMRIVNPKQFSDNSSLKPIKSILNYINHTIYHMKVDFEQSAYYQPVFYDTNDYDAGYNFDVLISNTSDYIKKCDFSLALSSIGALCDHFFKKVKYPVESYVWRNICFSVKLSLLNQLVLSSNDAAYIEQLQSTNRLKESRLLEIYNKNNFEVLLFHVDEKYRDIVFVLLNKLKAYISKNLSEALNLSYFDNSLQDFILNDYVSGIERCTNES